MIMVSACLVGLDSKYNGGSNYSEKAAELLKQGRAIVVCPEQMGGCTTPRKPCEIAEAKNGKDVLNGEARVVDSDGVDRTESFIKGAEETLKLAELCNIELAVLKSRSPSCGCGRIYDGSFSGHLMEGNGVTAELLQQKGYKVVTEEDIDDL